MSALACYDNLLLFNALFLSLVFIISFFCVCVCVVAFLLLHELEMRSSSLKVDSVSFNRMKSGFKTTATQ